MYVKQVPLGLQLKNENKYCEMIEIMSDLHQYVPIQEVATASTTSTDGTEQLPKEKVHTLLFGGDQLTASRARGCQDLRINSDTTAGKLKGLIPTAEDWHTAVTLLVVSCACD